MKKRWRKLGIVSGIVALATAGAVTTAIAANDVEQPDYTVISKADNIEIRQYDAMIVAQASVAGERRRAMNTGFRIIADYIFGNNLSSKEVAMTSPVTQQANEEIAMTSPVTQQSTGNMWQVRFIMPSEYTMETLPKPVNPQVEILEIPAKRVATIRFSGRAGQAAIDIHQNALVAHMEAEGLTAAAAPTYAFYDAPWIPPAMRRNEVLIEIADD